MSELSPNAGDSIKGNNNFASSSSSANFSNNNAGEAMYFGEYREPQGCFNACYLDNNNVGGDFQPYQLSMPATTTTSLSQAKDELKQTEEFLASEFNKLSFQERAKALEDIHCVAPEASALTSAAQPPNKSLPSTDHHWPRHPLHSNHLNHPELEPLPPEEQDPQSLYKLLDEFLALIQKENNPLYNTAILQNPDYLRNPVLRLMFLRANLYNVGDSVKQLLKFLKYKSEYFGKETLGRDITIEDMTQEEQRIMQSGFYHIHATRDKSGRVVATIFNHHFGQFDGATTIRITYYMWVNIILRMPGVQTKGMTGIYYDNVPPGEECARSSLGFFFDLVAFSGALPIKYSSMHFCLKNSTDGGGGALRWSLNNSALALLTRHMPQYTRVRMKIHFGSDMELLYQLQAYGIDLKTFPIDVRTGKVKSDDILNKWYYDYHNNKKKADDKTSLPIVDGNVEWSNQSGHDYQFDDLYLDKTMGNFIEQRNEGGMEDNALIEDSLDFNWDIDLLKDGHNDPTISIEEDLNQRGPSAASLVDHDMGGWLQTLVRDAFSFGAADMTDGDHDHTLETPNLSLGESGTSSSGTLTGPAPRLTSTADAVTVPLMLNAVQPAPDDILLGRGKNVQNHPGNVKFRKWLEEFRDEYERTPRHKRAQVATEMIQILSSNGVRLLKQETSQGQDNSKRWVVADSKEAEEKIKQLFRSRRKKQRE